MPPTQVSEAIPSAAGLRRSVPPPPRLVAHGGRDPGSYCGPGECGGYSQKHPGAPAGASAAHSSRVPTVSQSHGTLQDVSPGHSISSREASWSPITDELGAPSISTHTFVQVPKSVVHTHIHTFSILSPEEALHMKQENLTKMRQFRRHRAAPPVEYSCTVKAENHSAAVNTGQSLYISNNVLKMEIFKMYNLKPSHK